MQENVKVLCVDYGDRRTGLAYSVGSMAFGIGTIKPKGKHECAKMIADTASTKGCNLIVIGLPVNMDGTQGGRCDNVRLVGEYVSEYTDIPVEYHDERMSTMVASRYLNATNTRGDKRKGVVDTLSAEIILQDYLDLHKKG